MDATQADIDNAIVQLRDLQELITAHAIGLADRIAKKTVRKYPWIDPDDLRQELIIPLPRWIEKYNPDDKSKTSWSKYLYHKLNFYVKDVLRKEDPVGIKWPQREQYPTWFRLGDQSGRLSGRSDDGQDEAASHGGSQGGDCPSDLLGKSLVVDVDLTASEEDQIWQRDLAGLQKMAAKHRKRKSPAPMIDAGNGVCRAIKCPFFDSELGRVRFNPKKTTRLADYVGHASNQLMFW
jgi:hypothetical protein